MLLIQVAFKLLQSIQALQMHILFYIYCKDSFKKTKQVTYSSTGEGKSQISYRKKYRTFYY